MHGTTRDAGSSLWTRRAAKTVAVAVVALVSWPGMAFALEKPSSWAKSSNPLIAQYQTVKAYAYGTFKTTATSNGLMARANGSMKASNKSYPAYYILVSQSNAGRCQAGFNLGVDIVGTGGAFGLNYSCTQSFYDWDTEETRHTTSSAWDPTYTQTDVDDRANVMRGKVKACVQVPLQTDPCTGFGISGADSY